MQDRPYSDEFLRQQRRRLLDERERLLADIGHRQAELIASAGAENNGVDQHMAEDATDLYEHELGVTLIENSRYICVQVEEALARLEEGTYGWDNEAGCWIRQDRLEVLPWASADIMAAASRPKGQPLRGRQPYTHDADVTSL